MKAIVLSTFHYRGPDGICAAPVGSEIDVPEKEAREFASSGRVRLVEEVSPQPELPPEEPLPAADLAPIVTPAPVVPPLIPPAKPAAKRRRKAKS
jgi:hypothetical protein